MPARTRSATFNYEANRTWDRLPRGMTLHETPGPVGAAVEQGHHQPRTGGIGSTDRFDRGRELPHTLLAAVALGPGKAELAHCAPGVVTALHAQALRARERSDAGAQLHLPAVGGRWVDRDSVHQTCPFGVRMERLHPRHHGRLGGIELHIHHESPA